MTHLKTAAIRLAAAEAAMLVIACQKGILARAHNRPRDGVLVPKEVKADAAALREFQKGWDWLEAGIKADAE